MCYGSANPSSAVVAHQPAVSRDAKVREAIATAKQKAGELISQLNAALHAVNSAAD